MPGLWALALFLSILVIPSEAKVQSREWILTRKGTQLEWSGLVFASFGLRYLRSFGPQGKHAVFSFPADRNFSFDFLPSQLRDQIAAIQPNYGYHEVEADPEFSKAWHLKNTGQDISELGEGKPGADIDIERAWEITRGSDSVVVAVLDSGIDFNHPDLTHVLSQPMARRGWNFVGGNSNVQDDRGHGTVISGIIGADADNGKGALGISPQVSILPIKILDEFGNGTTENAVSGIDLAISRGADILNLSWGGPNYDPLLYDAIKRAEASGILIVTASGNFGMSNDSPVWAIYPASFSTPGLISVAAYDNRDELSGFSNFGKTKVHLGAPGVQILGPRLGGGYIAKDGTSFAAPQVAGVAALLKTLYPFWSPKELKDRLISTVSPLGYYEKENTITGGRLNAYNALKGIRPPGHVYPTHWQSFPGNWETPHPYPKNYTQNFLISSPGAEFIRVHFKSFDTEAIDDPVTLRDKWGNKITVYSGEMPEFNSAEAQGDELHIEFVSDFARTAQGFVIDRYEIGFH